MDCARRSRTDLRSQIIQSSKRSFSASLFHDRRALHDVNRFGSRLDERRGAPSTITPSIRVSSPEGPPAGAEVGHGSLSRRSRGGQRDSETLPPSGGRGGEVRSARESCSAAAAMRSQPCVRRPQRCARAALFCDSLPDETKSCSLLKSCARAVVASRRKNLGQM